MKHNPIGVELGIRPAIDRSMKNYSEAKPVLTSNKAQVSSLKEQMKSMDLNNPQYKVLHYAACELVEAIYRIERRFNQEIRAERAKARRNA